MERRDGAGLARLVALRRREASFVFLAFLLASLASLLMTSAKALLTDARFKDCLMELLVVGLDLGLPLAAGSEGMDSE